VIDPVLSEQRLLATYLVARLRERWPGALVADGVDLSSALEQQLYVLLRDRVVAPGGAWAALRRSSLRILSIGAAGLALRPMAHLPPRGALALIRQPVHASLLAPVVAALDALDGPAVEIVRVGAAAGRRVRHGRRLEALLDRRAARALVVPFDAPGAAELSDAWRPIAGTASPRIVELARRALDDLGAIRIGAIALRSALRATGASVVVTYDEVGRWGRLVAAAGSAAGVPSVDLPHAEAVDVVAMRGMAFDAVGVFGEVSAERVAAAGVPADRIVQIGSPALDGLIVRAAETRPPGRRRVVFASQYLGGVMTASIKERTVRTAIEAIGAAAPCELVLVPHPVERDGILGTVLDRGVPDGVEARMGAAGSLHDELVGAWLLVTGSSQSVIDATVASVPSITINAIDGPDAVPYASEGMALGATTADDAGAHITFLLDPGRHAKQVSRARVALRRRVGELDGRASERAAKLIIRMAASGPAGR
jgi:hypothetical protein